MAAPLTPLMPHATAAWLVDNTALTFEQIAQFCGLHILEVQAIADDTAATKLTGRDPIRAGEAYAEAEYLTGNPERALLQLNTLKRRQDLDYYARARIDARIAAITPTVLELRRQGIKDMDDPNG